MKNSVIKIIGQDKKNWLYFSIHLIATVIVSMIGLYVVEMARNIVDDGQNINENLSKYLLMAVLVTIGGCIFSYLQTYASARFSIQCVKNLRNAIVSKITYLEYNFFSQVHSGTLLNKINGDVDLIQSNLESSLPELLSALFKFATAFIYLAFINLKLVLCCVFLTVIVFIFVKIVINPISKIFDKHQKKLDEAMEIANDCISGVYIQKAYNLKGEFTKDFDDKMDELTRQALKRQKILAVTFPMTDILKFLPTLVCMVMGFVSTFQGQISSGDFVAFVVLLGKITEPMAEFPVLIAAYKEVFVCVKRLNQILDSKEEQDGTYKGGTKASKGTILSFEHVDFAYEKGQPVLQDLSFEVQKGKMAAFVGASGSGKSTLFKIISKLYSYQGGEVKFCGTELSKWNNQALREQIAYVPQEVYLFPCSIAENIAFGCPGATREQIKRAARLAQADGFIEQLPEGYDTFAGERGMKLSGGQCQRIAIARAFLKNAPVLLLDEMTSALDVESEKLLQKALETYAKDKTVMTIAHRLSTIINSDVIYVLDKGKIVETGSHEKLLKKNGAYARLYTKQLVEGEEDEASI